MGPILDLRMRLRVELCRPHDVRYGSEADVSSADAMVRFVPIADISLFRLAHYHFLGALYFRNLMGICRWLRLGTRTALDLLHRVCTMVHLRFAYLPPIFRHSPRVLTALA
jgi:hypothetical protein